MKISIVIPCFNEVETIEAILQRVVNVRLRLDKEIIIVDDYSTDGIREYLRSIGGKEEFISIIYHSQNKGKGSALRTGLKLFL
jgi:glycosyltransferase involved in cell wall biosynthesis